MAVRVLVANPVVEPRNRNGTITSKAKTASDTAAHGSPYTVTLNTRDYFYSVRGNVVDPKSPDSVFGDEEWTNCGAPASKTSGPKATQFDFALIGQPRSSSGHKKDDETDHNRALDIRKNVYRVILGYRELPLYKFPGSDPLDLDPPLNPETSIITYKSMRKPYIATFRERAVAGSNFDITDSPAYFFESYHLFSFFPTLAPDRYFVDVPFVHGMLRFTPDPRSLALNQAR